MRIQFVDLQRQYRALKAELDGAMAAVLERGDFILGKDTQEFEREFASFVGARHCLGVADGTDALHLALLALGVGPGDEVIVPANTYIATALAVSNTGARVVLVDCEPQHHTIDVAAVRRAITSRTKVILPVHLFGHPADMDPLVEIARKRGLRIVEDAAQAHGALYKGRNCGAMGDIGCFSFYPGKNLGCYGDGGAVVTNSPELADRLGLLRNYGQRVKYVHEVKGFNSRLDTLQAAVLRVKLKHLAAWNESRRAAAKVYTTALASAGVTLPTAAAWATPVWHLYVVQVAEREKVQAALAKNGIASGIHYPIPIHLQQAYRDLGHQAGAFPVSERLAGRILSLPMFPEITTDELRAVCSALGAGNGS